MNLNLKIVDLFSFFFKEHICFCLTLPEWVRKSEWLKLIFLLWWRVSHHAGLSHV